MLEGTGCTCFGDDNMFGGEIEIFAQFGDRRCGIFRLHRFIIDTLAVPFVRIDK